jgi:hypothetical protein
VKVGISAILIVIGVAVAVGGSYLLGLHALTQSQHALCPIVRLVTAKPIPRPTDPAKNPSRVANYEFYEDFAQVRQQYGC